MDINPLNCISDSLRFFTAEGKDTIADGYSGEPRARDVQWRGIADFSGARINPLDQTQESIAIESTPPSMDLPVYMREGRAAV